MRQAVFISIASVLLVLTGCADRRIDQVREHVTANVPENTEIVSIGDFSLEAVGGGLLRANVPVTYRVQRETFAFIDGMELPGGQELAARADAVRDWATERLPDGDAVRSAVDRGWAMTRHGFTLKRPEAAAGTEFPAVVTLELQPDGASWTVSEIGTTLVIPGTASGGIGVPVIDSPEATRRAEEIARMTTSLERIKADWLAAFERRAELARADLAGRLATGLAYVGRAGTDPVRLVVSRGFDLGDVAVVVLTDARLPQGSARFAGSIERLEDGSAVWRGERTAVISTGDGTRRLFATSDGATELTLAFAEGRLRGQAHGLALSFDAPRQIDVIPETEW